MEGEKASHAACLRASSDAGGRTWSKPGASRASGKQRLKSERIVRSCRWDTWSRSESARGAALPMEGKKALRAACLRASSDAGGRTWKQAKSFMVERGAAFKIGALRLELSVGCLEPLEECQGCNAPGGRQRARWTASCTQVPLLDLARRKAGCTEARRPVCHGSFPAPIAVRAAARGSAAHLRC